MTPWLHLIIHTYGTWLPGDPRGHRTRHHRQHVDGDSKEPPPDTPERRAHHAYAKKLMNRDPVVLTHSQRERIAHELRASLERQGCEVHTLCVDATHAHILARLPKPTDPNPWVLRTNPNPRVIRKDPNPRVPCTDSRPSSSPRHPLSAHIRQIVGIAKKDAARALSDDGLAPRGGLWSKRGLAKPIRDEAQFNATIAYIHAHKSQGAVLKPTDPNPWACERNE